MLNLHIEYILHQIPETTRFHTHNLYAGKSGRGEETPIIRQ